MLSPNSVNDSSLVNPPNTASCSLDTLMNAMSNSTKLTHAANKSIPRWGINPPRRIRGRRVTLANSAFVAFKGFFPSTFHTATTNGRMMIIVDIVLIIP